MIRGAWKLAEGVYEILGEYEPVIRPEHVVTMHDRDLREIVEEEACVWWIDDSPAQQFALMCEAPLAVILLREQARIALREWQEDDPEGYEDAMDEVAYSDPAHFMTEREAAMVEASYNEDWYGGL